MIKSIGQKVWHNKVSFKGSLAHLFYADGLVMAFNGKWW